MTNKEIPIFPLHSVLFPGGALPLRIFESRYLDMISQCMKRGDNFGICLIEEGSEVGDAPKIHNIGTLAEISYFQQLKDGCLGITVRGLQRFKIISSEVKSNQLTVANVELLPKEEPIPLPDDFGFMVEILKKSFEQLGHPFISLPKHYDDGSWVGARMTELLPIKRSQKQALLEICDPHKRLEELVEILKEGGYI